MKKCIDCDELEFFKDKQDAYLLCTKLNKYIELAGYYGLSKRTFGEILMIVKKLRCTKDEKES